MVEQKKSSICITINAIPKQPKKFLPLCNFHRVYLIRYTFHTIIRNWNPNYTGQLQPISFNGSTNPISIHGCEYQIESSNGYAAIQSVKSTYNHKQMKVTFYPALPDINALKEEIELGGNFSFDADSIKGILGGSYHLQKKGKTIQFTIHPTDGWQPMPGKNWMSTYLWSAQINLLENSMSINGRWSRI